MKKHENLVSGKITLTDIAKEKLSCDNWGTWQCNDIKRISVHLINLGTEIVKWLKTEKKKEN